MSNFDKNMVFTFNLLLITFLLNVKTYAQEFYTMENTKLINGIRYNTNEEPINGVLYVYYSTGELLLETRYKDGRLDGVTRGYRLDGTLYQEIIYKNSKEIKRNTYPQNKPIIA